MTRYLIEFRFQGYAKKYIKNLIFEVGRKFKVRGVTRKRPVPHVSLYGPFTTRNEKKMVETVHLICKKYDLIPFTISGFNHFQGKKTFPIFGKRVGDVIYVDIKPSKKMEQLRWEIAKSLNKFCYPQPHDKKKEFFFHSTVAFKDIENKFNDIYKYLQEKEEKNIKQSLVRLTIIKNNRILYEYDLIQKRLLNRQEAKSKLVWRKTINMLKSK